VELLLQQFGHLDGLLAVQDAPPAACRREVVERQAGPAQLMVERRQAFGRRLAAALHRRQAEPYGGQRPAQLVAGARDELAAPAQLEDAERGQREADHRQRPGDDAQGHVPVLGASAQKFAPLWRRSRVSDPPCRPSCRRVACGALCAASFDTTQTCRADHVDPGAICAPAFDTSARSRPVARACDAGLRIGRRSSCCRMG
jgi:hypothetical protein